MNPNPIEYRASRLSETRDATRREVYCPHYSACLGQAVKQGWDDWSCQACPLADSCRPPDARSYANDRRGNG